MTDFLECPTFNLAQAVLLAHAADIAYASPTLLQAWTRRQGLGEATVFDQRRTQGFYARSASAAVLAFRGTGSIGQVIRDLRFLPAAHAWGNVHTGFRVGIDAVEDQLEAFHEASRDTENLWITGHSLGGALAVLAAAWLKANKGRHSRIITFGQPSVGLGAFATRFQQELPGSLLRFVNRDDLIARLPPGFTHCPQPKHITDDGLQFANRPPLLTEEELPPLSEAEHEALIQQIDSMPPLDLEEGDLELQGAVLDRIPWLADHRMRGYIASLETLLAAGEPAQALTTPADDVAIPLDAICKPS